MQQPSVLVSNDLLVYVYYAQNQELLMRQQHEM